MFKIITRKEYDFLMGLKEDYENSVLLSQDQYVGLTCSISSLRDENADLYQRLVALKADLESATRQLEHDRSMHDSAIAAFTTQLEHIRRALRNLETKYADLMRSVSSAISLLSCNSVGYESDVSCH